LLVIDAPLVRASLDFHIERAAQAPESGHIVGVKWLAPRPRHARPRPHIIADLGDVSNDWTDF
jgi:hypothetical protein